MKTRLRFLALMLAVVMCFTLLAGCGEDTADDKETTAETAGKENGGKEEEKEEVKIDPAADPHGAVAAAIEKLGGRYFGSFGDVYEVLAKAGSGTATYEIDLYADETDISLDAIVDAAASKGKLTLGFEYDNISTSADLWIGDSIALYAPAILGDSTYGVDLRTLEDDLKTSPIFELFGFASYDEFCESFEESTGTAFGDMLASVKDLGGNTAVEEDFIKDVTDALKSCVAKVGEEKYGDEDAYKIVFTVTDKEVSKLVDAYSALLDDTYGMLGGMYADLPSSLKDAIDSAGEFSYDLTVYVSKGTGDLLAAEIEIEIVKIKLECTDDAIVFTGSTGESEEEYSYLSEIVLSYKLTGGSGKRGFELTVSNNEEYDDVDDEYDYNFRNDVKLVFDLDTQKGEWMLNVITPEDIASSTFSETTTASFGGAYKCDDKSVTFGINKAVFDGEDAGIELTCSVKLGGSVAAAPNYKNVLKMDESDWEVLFEAIENSVIYKAFTEPVKSEGIPF